MRTTFRQAKPGDLFLFVNERDNPTEYLRPDRRGGPFVKMEHTGMHWFAHPGDIDMQFGIQDDPKVDIIGIYQEW